MGGSDRMTSSLGASRLQPRHDDHDTESIALGAEGGKATSGCQKVDDPAANLLHSGLPGGCIVLLLLPRACYLQCVLGSRHRQTDSSRRPLCRCLWRALRGSPDPRCSGSFGRVTPCESLVERHTKMTCALDLSRSVPFVRNALSLSILFGAVGSKTESQPHSGRSSFVKSGLGRLVQRAFLDDFSVRSLQLRCVGTLLLSSETC